MPKPKLTYFFEAEYYDGKVFKQHPDDISLKYPPTYDDDGQLQGKSSFSDIREDIENHLVRRFTLVGKGQKVSVNLETGLFEVNGLAILLESEKLPIKPEHFDLVYYRQRTENQNIHYKVGSGEVTGVDIQDTFIEYFIGWRCNISGREYVQKLAVA